MELHCTIAAALALASNTAAPMAARIEAAKTALAGLRKQDNREGREARQGREARRKVTALTRLHPTISVDQDDTGTIWVYCDLFEGSDHDPLLNAHYADTWQEALEHVQTYAAAMSDDDLLRRAGADCAADGMDDIPDAPMAWRDGWAQA